MKGVPIAAMLLLSLASCERNAGPRPGNSSSPRPGAQADRAQGEAGGDREDRPVLIEKKAPVAERIQGQPGMVISPFNGKPIDVKGIPAGTLVADPTYPLEDKKYFRVPELLEEAGEPPKLLDPGILIRPNPKEERTKEKEP